MVAEYICIPVLVLDVFEFSSTGIGPSRLWLARNLPLHQIMSTT